MRGEDSAPAATAVFLERSMPFHSRPQPVPFIADHPFLILVRHVASGQILFMGRVDDPR